VQTSYRDFVKSNIFNNGYLRNILIVSILLVTVLPLYNFLVISPLFSKFLAESTNNTSVRVAKHFASMFGQNKTVLNKDHIQFDESRDINELRSDFRLTKLKIYSNSGEVLFSTDPEDIGNTNTQKYFHEVVAKGNIVTKGITKETESLEGELMPVDVIETYVPVMNGKNFIGAVEIYYDITAEKQQLNKMLTRSSVLVFLIALGLLIASMVILFIEKKIIYKRKLMQKERENLIADLQDAIAKINTLKGLLPICANCKKIRDDKDRWEQIEFYIREHSEAEFTHSICPECAKKLYPDLDL
jgi:sensor histidine kinase regulating citrate/malate metabolism